MSSRLPFCFQWWTGHLWTWGKDLWHRPGQPLWAGSWRFPPSPSSPSGPSTPSPPPREACYRFAPTSIPAQMTKHREASTCSNSQITVTCCPSQRFKVLCSPSHIPPASMPQTAYSPVLPLTEKEPVKDLTHSHTTAWRSVATKRWLLVSHSGVVKWDD